MIYSEDSGDLFKVPSNYYLAHCISSDCEMGAGIAVTFQSKFHLRQELLSMPEEKRKHPTCIRIGRVFNLITKKRYYNKPTLGSLRSALEQMRQQAEAAGIHHIAMYRLGCTRDKLSWPQVRETIQDVFASSDIEILVRTL